MNTVGIVATTYNNIEHIKDLIESCQQQTYKEFKLVIADDGSIDDTPDIIEYYAKNDSRIKLLRLNHGERGIARITAIEESIKLESDYLLIIDSDMSLEYNLLEKALEKFEKDSMLDALIIKEMPFSKYSNFYSKVKVFERILINNSGEKVDKNSIEAARFWKMKSYIETGGINPKQISFEEIQPTIRCLEKGGKIIKLMHSGVKHDEKEVTLKNLLQKKKYYFSKINQTIETEVNGLKKTLSRWYFFRPVYYQKDNLKLYIRHPLLTLGVIYMYFCLTFIGAFELFKNRKRADGIE